MWETTFPRNSHAGLGKPTNENNILPSMHETSLSPCPIRRGYFSEMLFPTWSMKVLQKIMACLSSGMLLSFVIILQSCYTRQ